MFAISEAEATAIRDAFRQHGEFAAAVELRRLFPGVIDNRLARECVRTIAGWQPKLDQARCRTVRSRPLLHARTGTS